MTNYAVKIDSNSSGLRYCEELRTAALGTLPVAASQVWYSLEPNSYQDFGVNTKTVARMPINPSRQLQKGVLVDMDPAGGFQNDLTQDGLTRILQSFFFANLRESFDNQSFNSAANPATAVVGSSHTVKFTSGVDVVLANEMVKLSGFVNVANNGLFEVASETTAAATGVLTSSDQYIDGDTVTIGTRVYTLQGTLTAGDGHVHIGASEAATILNLTHAINNSGGVPGTDYNVTAADPLVTAVAASHTCTVTAIAAGYGGNAIATTNTESDADAAWGAATLTGGQADMVLTTGLSDETPPATARVEVVGYQGGSGDLAIVNVPGALPYMTSVSLDFTTLPLIAGQWLWIGGDSAASEFATATNDGWARIRAITTHTMSFDKTNNELVTDSGSAKTIQLFWGKVLQNEYNPALQVRRSYTFERTLGFPNLALPTTPQAEYLKGLVANELTVNMATAAKIELDLAFLGTDYATIDTTGVILSQVGGASAPMLVEEDAYNTTSHVSRARMTVLAPSDTTFTDADPSTYFAEVTELKFILKNNIKPNKALGKLGPFEMSAGFFEGSGSVQAYFSQVAAVQAVRNNADVTIDFALAKNNQGILFDLPLLTLKSKGLDVKINEPIMLPLELQMGADKNFNTTMFTEWFSYLPTAAMPS